MKWLAGAMIALSITVLLSLGLFGVLKTPIDANPNKGEPSIEFTDMVFDESKHDEITAAIKELIDEPQTCKLASECRKSYYGCPFGCSSIVNNSNHTQILELKEILEQTSGTKCEYSCLYNGKKTSPACIDKQCTLVETIDGKEHIRAFIDSNK